MRLINADAILPRLRSISEAEHQIYGEASWGFARKCIAVVEDAITEEAKSAQPEACEYYALCRHGRDERKLCARLKFCEYCNEDSDGYVKPIEKNNHAFVRFGMDGWELNMKANGWYGSAKIRYCPMCGRELKNG